MNRRNSVSVQNTITPISSQWAKDYGLIKWTNLTLFDEYLEMSKTSRSFHYSLNKYKTSFLTPKSFNTVS
jgi:hypothetical protein